MNGMLLEYLPIFVGSGIMTGGVALCKTGKWVATGAAVIGLGAFVVFL